MSSICRTSITKPLFAYLSPTCWFCAASVCKNWHIEACRNKAFVDAQWASDKTQTYHSCLFPGCCADGKNSYHIIPRTLYHAVMIEAAGASDEYFKYVWDESKFVLSGDTTYILEASALVASTRGFTERAVWLLDRLGPTVMLYMPPCCAPNYLRLVIARMISPIPRIKLCTLDMGILDSGMRNTYTCLKANLYMIALGRGYSPHYNIYVQAACCAHVSSWSLHGHTVHVPESVDMCTLLHKAGAPMPTEIRQIAQFRGDKPLLAWLDSIETT